MRRMISSYPLEIGALHRRDVMVRLDQLGLSYVEHRGFLESTIVIQIFSEREAKILLVFRREFLAFVRRLQANEDEIEREDLERKILIYRKKLARKNRWRTLTFRRPVLSLR